MLVSLRIREIIQPIKDNKKESKKRKKSRIPQPFEEEHGQ
jgi:hypothetical protein